MYNQHVRSSRTSDCRFGGRTFHLEFPCPSTMFPSRLIYGRSTSAADTFFNSAMNIRMHSTQRRRSLFRLTAPPAFEASLRHAMSPSAPPLPQSVGYCKHILPNMHSNSYSRTYRFGYDQGVVSVILVEQQFLGRFGQVADDAPGSGFWKGLLTAMIELGALLGALNQGWLADRYSRKYSIVLAVGVFIVGSVLQTAAMDYTMLVVARFIGE